MVIRQAILSAITNIRSRKLRSFLTMLGMIIGISSVMIIMSVGVSAQDLILGQVRGLGSNLIGVLPGASDENGPPASVFGLTVTTLTYEDALALGNKSNVPYVEAVAAYVSGAGTLSWQNQSTEVTFTGTTASYVEVEDTGVAAGRFFDEQEDRSLARVVVLGSQTAQDLFGEQDPIGQTIKIKRENFEVIGVMKERGSAFFENQDDKIFIPLLTAQKLLLGINHLGFARVKVQDGYVEQSVEDVRTTLRYLHDIEDPSQDDFSVRNVAQAAEVFTQITNALRFFLASIAAIALLVGGIGIMNIMLVSVNERVREIGLRKAVGARRGAIITQFLIETIVLSLLGGIFGILFGTLVIGLIYLVASALGYTWSFVVTLDSILIACGVSAAIGLLFGLYPAVRASNLDPIEALRYE
jgi:putative ABC transport system permease protein